MLAHKDAYTYIKRTAGVRELCLGGWGRGTNPAAERCKAYLDALDIPSLLRSPTVQASPLPLAKECLGYITDTMNNGADVTYLALLQAMVDEAGVLAPEHSLAVARSLAGRLMTRHTCNALIAGLCEIGYCGGSSAATDDPQYAWGKFLALNVALEQACRRRILAAAGADLQLLLEGGGRGFAQEARRRARESWGSAAAAFRSLALGLGILLPLQQHGLLGSAEAVAAMLELCLPMAAAHPEELLKAFPRGGCGGCVYLQLACAVALHPQLDGLAAAVMGALMGDLHFRVIERGELQQLAGGLQRAYRRQEDPFPHMGYCQDFDSPQYGAFAPGAVNNKVGALLKSPGLRAWMARDPDAAVAAATAFCAGPGGGSDALQSLLPEGEAAPVAEVPWAELQRVLASVAP